MPSRRSMVFWKYMFDDPFICAWVYVNVFHAIRRMWGSDMLKSVMIYSLQTSAFP